MRTTEIRRRVARVATVVACCLVVLTLVPAGLWVVYLLLMRMRHSRKPSGTDVEDFDATSA